MCSPYRMGIDVGSTTSKIAIINKNTELIYHAYTRHNAETRSTAINMLEDALASHGDLEVELTITGSAGMGLCEAYDIPFVQEVIASAEVVKLLYPEVKTLIENHLLS